MPYYGYKPAEQAIQIGDNTIVSADIADGSIVNADINSSAAIAMSKTQLTAGTGITLSTNTLNVDAAQTQITSLGTLTALQIDNVNIDGNTITTTNTNGTLTITPNGTGNVDLNTDRLNIQSTEGESTSIRLSADEGDDSGDDWLLLSNTDNTFTIGNDASGSNVAQITLTPNSTVASSTTAIAGNTTVGGNLTLDGSSSRQIEFKDGSTSEGAIVFDEITNGLVFKVGGTSGSSKLDALKITSGGEFTMTSGSDMIVNLVSTATNGKEYEIQSTDAGNLTFVRRTGSAAEILRFSGSDDSANFDGDILGNTAGSFRLINGQGSASSPSYAFHSDTNTGMFRAANGVLGFTTFGTERLRITGTGDIWHNNGNTVEHALAGHTNELNISHHWNSGQATIHFCYRMENTYTDFTFYNGAGSGHPDLNAASFDTTSDYRMKKSVANFTDNVCDKIKLLRPITYNWKANTKMNEAKQIGFLAHELQEQLPLAVKGEKDAMSEKDDTLIAPQSIKGEALSSYMMKALQEIITRLEALENA